LDIRRALCVDTDALVNLLGLDVFDGALDCIGLSRADCYCLRAAKRQIESSSWVMEQWPFFDRGKAGLVIRDLKFLPSAPAPDLLEVLNIDGIDEGEAYFLAALCENPGYLLLSGDRRMLEAFMEERTPESFRSARPYEAA
jgi:hypothetical protein